MFKIPGSREGDGFYCPKWQVAGPVTIVERVNAQSIPNNVFWTSINWDTIVRDDANGFTPNNNAFLTVPPWCKFARLTAYAIWQNTSGNLRTIGIYGFNDGTIYGNGYGSYTVYTDTNEGGNRTTTGWIPVAPGQNFVMLVQQNDGAARNFSGVGIFAAPAWFMGEWSPD